MSQSVFLQQLLVQMSDVPGFQAQTSRVLLAKAAVKKLFGALIKSTVDKSTNFYRNRAMYHTKGWFYLSQFQVKFNKVIDIFVLHSWIPSPALIIHRTFTSTKLNFNSYSTQDLSLFTPKACRRE